MDSNNRKKKSHSGLMIIIGIILVVGLLGSCMNKCGCSSSSKSETCKVCHKTFTNKDDVKSIRWTDMCEKCYSDYEFTSKVKEETLKYYENHR